MGKYGYEIVAAFAPQALEGTFDPTLAAITTAITEADGLLLGDAQSGIAESGLSLTVGRNSRDKPFWPGSFTRSLSDFLNVEFPTFTMAFPFTGNRAPVSGAPADTEFDPIVGIQAMLEGTGLIGSDWGAGIGRSYQYGNPVGLLSALIWYNGVRLQLKDCRCSLSVLYVPQDVAIATATISVGAIDAKVTEDAPATVTYGNQAGVSAPVVLDAEHTWGANRGFSTGTLNLAPATEDIPDSNQPTGRVVEQTDRETTWEATLFKDDSDKGYEYDQVVETQVANLDPVSFTIGDAALTPGDPMLAHQILMPEPEAREDGLNALGTKAAADVVLLGRGSSANSELEIIFS